MFPFDILVSRYKIFNNCAHKIIYAPVAFMRFIADCNDKLICPLLNFLYCSCILRKCTARTVKDGGKMRRYVTVRDTLTRRHRCILSYVCPAHMQRRRVFGPRRKPPLLNYPLNTTTIRRIAPAPFHQIQCNLGKISWPIKSGAYRLIFVCEQGRNNIHWNSERDSTTCLNLLYRRIKYERSFVFFLFY